MKKLLFSLVLAANLSAGAQLHLPAFFASDMVLQRDQVNRIWGQCTPGSLVTVSFQQKNYQAYADARGDWSVFLNPVPAGAAGDLLIRSGAEEKKFTGLLAGDVWICSGQSNMEWPMSLLMDTYPEELTKAVNDQIRYTVVARGLSNEPQQDLQISQGWTGIRPQTIGNCSAVAYFFAKKINKELHIPVGLIVTSWGGTPAQSWASFEGLHDFPNYTELYSAKIKNLPLDHYAERLAEAEARYHAELQQQAAPVHAMLMPEYNDAGWKTMKLPGEWEQQGYPGLDGVVAYRMEIHLPAAMDGKAGTIALPAIDDIDSTFINGVFIGTITQWDAPRTYLIPAGVLKAGKNLLSVRVEDGGGGGGLMDQPDHFYVEAGGQKIMLGGEARYFIGVEKKGIANGLTDLQLQPAVLYNAMIAPLLPLKIKGAIWYQGESNADLAVEYRTLFPAMIQDWRNRWGLGDFPFLFVQLSSFGKLQDNPANSNWALLREAQTGTLRLPNTGMAVTIDVGNPNDIHPHKKQEVGNRLAMEALRMVYGQSRMVSSGPAFQRMTVKGNTVEISFTHTGKGLRVNGKTPGGFEIAGADKKFVWADAVVKGNVLILSSKQITKPVAVRYAWADSPVQANLFNKEGFPAVPFRTDDW